MAVVSGRSFAGNASIAGISDVVFATRGSAIGIGGPPLVEAALGIAVTPEELAPSEMHERNGGIDLLIDNDAEGADLVRRYLSYFLVERTDGTPSPTHDTIRSIVPDNRRGLYDMRKVVRALADDGSVFELRPAWGTAAITALARLGGHAVAVIANQPLSPIAGAIDCGRRRQAGPLHPPGRRLRPADRVADGQPRVHARPRRRAGRHRPPPRPPAHGPGAPHGAALSSSTSARPTGSARWRWAGMSQPTDLRLAWPTVEAGGMALEGAAALIQRREQREQRASGAADGRRPTSPTSPAARRHGSVATSWRRACGRGAWPSTPPAGTPTTR